LNAVDLAKAKEAVAAGWKQPSPAISVFFWYTQRPVREQSPPGVFCLSSGTSRRSHAAEWVGRNSCAAHPGFYRRHEFSLRSERSGSWL